MGHTLVGDLPKTERWRAVVALLNDDALSAPELARLTLLASRRRLLQLRGDPSLTYCVWLLARLGAAARGGDFSGDAALLGIPVRPGDTALGVIAAVTDRVRTELAQHPESGPFGEMASLALRRTLVETVGTESRSLFGSSAEDLERAFRRHTTAAQFGELAERFFGDFVARTLRFYVDRAIPAAVGGGPLPDIGTASEFTAALDRHARETAGIVEGFASGWYSKQAFLQGGRIGREQAEGFATKALSKLRIELEREPAR